MERVNVSPELLNTTLVSVADDMGAENGRIGGTPLGEEVELQSRVMTRRLYYTYLIILRF